jgi:hypothetical protein
MLQKIWRYDGAIPIGDASTTAALDGVERLLNMQRKANITRSADACSYADPVAMVFFGPGWPVMAMYNAGRFWVAQGAAGRQLHYALNARYRVVYGAAFMVILAALGFATYARGLGAFYFLAAFIVLLIGQWFLDRYRIPAALRKAVASAAAAQAS